MDIINNLYRWIFSPPPIPKINSQNAKRAHIAYITKAPYSRKAHRYVRLVSWLRKYNEDPKLSVGEIMRLARAIHIHNITFDDSNWPPFPAAMFYFNRTDYVPRGYIPKYALGLHTIYPSLGSSRLIKGVSSRSIILYGDRKIIKLTIWNAPRARYY